MHRQEEGVCTRLCVMDVDFLLYVCMFLGGNAEYRIPFLSRLSISRGRSYPPCFWGCRLVRGHQRLSRGGNAQGPRLLAFSYLSIDALWLPCPQCLSTAC